MKAAVIRKYGNANDVLEVTEIPKPQILPDEVLVETHAAAINPIDYKLRNGGREKTRIKSKFPITMGFDLSGVVVEVGEQVTGFKKGDEVFGCLHIEQFGTFAQYVAAKENKLVKKPANLTHKEATSIPLVGLTSWQVLEEIAGVKKGQKVFIQAGSGGIGTIAIQIAKYLGAYVATTTSEKNIEMVRGLGADLVINYKSQDFEQELKDYDVVVDTLGGNSLRKSFSTLKAGGIVITLLEIPTARWAKEQGLSLPLQLIMRAFNYKYNRLAKKYGVRYEAWVFRSDSAQLTQISHLLAQGKIKPVVDREFSLDEIKSAFSYIESGHARGKVVIVLR